MPTIHAEQAVYGSFPFWTKGYGLLAKSPGCREEWVAEFVRLCQGFGEPTSGVSGDGALFCMRLPRVWPWIIVRVAGQGADDRGRPGALAFHALFLSAVEFARIGYDPFLLVDAFRSEWTESTVLEPLNLSIPEPVVVEQSSERPLSAYLTSGGRAVLIESSTPIEDVARATYSALSIRERRRYSVTTLTFRGRQSFMLAAKPRISSEDIQPGVIVLTAEEALRDTREMDPEKLREYFFLEKTRDGETTVESLRTNRSEPTLRRINRRRAAACAMFALAAVVFVVWRFGFSRESGGTNPPPPVIQAPASTSDDERPVEPDERSRLVEGLIEIGERFHVVMPASVDPTSLMREIDKQLRYRGAWLSEADRGRIERESGEDRDVILDWDRHLQSFRSDRNLPADFADRPLREQVKLFAWSFRLEADPKRSLGEVPHALMDALSVKRPVRPSPVESKYPALGEYVRFLERLPRR